MRRTGCFVIIIRSALALYSSFSAYVRHKLFDDTENVRILFIMLASKSEGERERERDCIITYNIARIFDLEIFE